MNIKEIFHSAISKGASDIHLIVGLPPVFRIDGLLERQEGEALDREDLSKTSIFFLDEKQRQDFEHKRDIDISYSIGDTRFRINLGYEKGHIKLSARIISSKIPSMEDILMPEIAYELLKMKEGLVIVTGPTGCGKTTTLAAMIEHINENRSCNIITLEDPIEFIFSPKKSIITQRQLRTDMPSFASGLRNALRQDPNVVMVGEMRDLETISAVVTLAETGHLVLATLHTYSAAQTVDRIIDIFPPYQQNQIKSQLSMSLSAVISQRLLPRIGGGRVAAREIMVNNSATSNLIKEGKTAQIRTVIETSAEDGMLTMERSIKELVKNGLVTDSE